MTKPVSHQPAPPRRRLPRSFKDLTPSNHFKPHTFFRELVWKALLTPRTGQHRRPVFPKLMRGQVAVTWIGHASFLIQFTDLNVLIDPNFANWLFLLKRIKRAGLEIPDLPPIDLVLLTHAHFDHFHKPTLRRLPHPKIGVMPRGVGDLAHNLGFARIIELDWWESFSQRDWKVTFTPSRHWGARTIARPASGLRRISAGTPRPENLSRGRQRLFRRFQGNRRTAYAGNRAAAHRRVSSGILPPRPHGAGRGGEGIQDLRARWLVPMHYGTFKLSFEEIDEPPRRFRQVVEGENLAKKVRMLEEGVPTVF